MNTTTKILVAVAAGLFTAAVDVLGLIVKGAACAMGALYVAAHFGVI